MSEYSASIVIIGGGISGVSTAYELAKRGMKDIIV
ncbi:MAG: FAD-dependent oxidoreductase, partial [Clostridia bacterium]|nr:FAD-dependent oxidoreductase [Clostridia bacterium]